MNDAPPRPRVVAAVTGTRAEFGLLRPIMRAIDADPALDLRPVVTGAHLLPPAHTANEVAAAFDVAHQFEMQRPGESGRMADAAALGRGVAGFASFLASAPCDVVLVLGDRIEAFAAAAAGAVAGVHVAHLHGGDRAEGIADEALRHAITKLAHVHLPATPGAAERIIAMGEEPRCTHCVGSPAMDDLDSIAPLDDAAYAELGSPEIVLLLHPTGRADDVERDATRSLLARCRGRGRVLALHPNHDAGRDGVVAAITEQPDVPARAHLPREAFIGLLRRARAIVGNSSAGLIECAALPVWCVNVGSRQGGRERPAHVIDCPDGQGDDVERAIARAVAEPVPTFSHPYGDGRTGERTCAILRDLDADNHPLVKRNTY